MDSGRGWKRVGVRRLALAFTAPVALFAAWKLLRVPEEPDWIADFTSRVEILPRSEWHAEPPTGELATLGEPRKATLHHSGAVFHRTKREEVAESIRAIQRFHQKVRGWKDIAYHLVIDPAGRVWEGRPLSARGAHAGNRRLNEGNVGIVVLGDSSRQELTPECLEALECVLDALTSAAGIPRSRVYGHGELRKSAGLSPTECPGRRLEEWLGEWRRREP